MSARVDRRRDANWAAAVYWRHLVRPIGIRLVQELSAILLSRPPLAGSGRPSSAHNKSNP